MGVRRKGKGKVESVVGGGSDINHSLFFFFFAGTVVRPGTQETESFNAHLFEVLAITFSFPVSDRY